MKTCLLASMFILIYLVSCSSGSGQSQKEIPFSYFSKVYPIKHTMLNITTEKSNLAILAEIGNRLKEYRNAGISLDTVVRMERGSSITTKKFLRILKTLDMLENLEEFIPVPPISPILMRKLQGKKDLE